LFAPILMCSTIAHELQSPGTVLNYLAVTCCIHAVFTVCRRWLCSPLAIELYLKPDDGDAPPRWILAPAFDENFKHLLHCVHATGDAGLLVFHERFGCVTKQGARGLLFKAWAVDLYKDVTHLCALHVCR